MPREKATRIIPLAPIDRLIRKAGGERVSEQAASELGEVLEELGIEIAIIAKELSEFAGRKTVTRRDIKLAYKQWQRKRR
jgi:histone H3/H4